MLIYLIGYMGAGKTTYGKRLARDINYNFIDLDQKIEARPLPKSLPNVARTASAKLSARR